MQLIGSHCQSLHCKTPFMTCQTRQCRNTEQSQISQIMTNHTQFLIRIYATDHSQSKIQWSHCFLILSRWLDWTHSIESSRPINDLVWSIFSNTWATNHILSFLFLFPDTTSYSLQVLPHLTTPSETKIRHSVPSIRIPVRDITT